MPTATSTGPTELAADPLGLRLLDAPARWTALDVVGQPLSELIQRVEPAWLKDLLHGTWLGHPLHPVLAQLTAGSWTSAAVLDGVSLAGLVPEQLQEGIDAASTSLAVTGLVTAGPTIASGWTDWSGLHEDQQRIGIVHAVGNYAAAALVGISLWQRWRGRHVAARWSCVGASAAASLGAALGGHLSFRWAAGTNHAEHVAHVAPPGWHRVGTWDELIEGSLAQSWVGDVPVVVARTSDGVRVLADSCSHLSASLSGGRLVTERGETCLVCPWHDSVFRLNDGAVVHGPATAPQPMLEARVDADGAVMARVRDVG